MLERLLELGKTVLAEKDLDRLLTAAIDGVIELCGAERGMILLFDHEGAVVVETARNLAREDLERPELEVSRTILERVRATGEPFWHPNVLDDPALGDRASVLRLLLLSVICQPIRDGDRLLGVVYLDTRSAERVFSEETARLVASFSDLISLAARNALEQRRLQQRISALSDELRGRYDFGAIVGQDPKMLAVLKLVSQVADSDATVLIGGESGTGKELVARAVHFNSRRRAKPFIAVNCGALPENLLESELFGHLRGAFTGAVRDNPGWFERAEGGTLLLDEVGELAPPLQVKLLRVLENGEYSRVGSTQIRRADVRIVAATNRDLETLVREGKVRQDFLYRLNVVEVRLPSLRERRSDLPLLIRHFLGRLGGRRGEETKKLAPEAEALLLAYDWPGNIRELQNVIQRAILLAEGPVIEACHLPDGLRELRPLLPPLGAGDETAASGFRAAKQRVVERFEREYLTRCLSEARGNISQAAKAAGIDYKNFYTKLQQYGIEPGEFKAQTP
ncbi:MAG TPA: sigma-54-dependent Fis family transcriptional regulator [Thermoanaerobaculia bacterium]|jgi:Nif-specific regulatory protein|nr:sigma-54-dependent Fis family transcriptional regulator [Thermoanaerobaculia bacterium]